MAGFPSRVLRSVFGSRLRDPVPVVHPEHDIGADRINLLEQVATASGLMIPRVTLVAEWTGSAMSAMHQEEAWNTRHEVAHPVIARTSAGLYTYQFDAAYADEDGASVSVNLVFARATPMVDMSTGYSARGSAYAWIDAADPTLVRVSCWDSSGAVADRRFLLEVW
jgi:hypothetical protein